MTCAPTEARSEQVSLQQVERRISETRDTLAMLESLHAAIVAGGGGRLAIVGQAVMRLLQYAGPSQLDAIAAGTGLPRCEVEAFLLSERASEFFQTARAEPHHIGCRDDGTFYYRQRAAPEPRLDGCRKPNIGIRITSFLKRSQSATAPEIAAETLLPLDDVEAYLMDAYQYREVQPGVWALKTDLRQAELQNYRLPDVPGERPRTGRKRKEAPGSLNAQRIAARRRN